MAARNTFGNFGTLEKTQTGPIMKDCRIDRVSKVPVVVDPALTKSRVSLPGEPSSAKTIVMEYGEGDGQSMHSAAVKWSSEGDVLVCDYCTNEAVLRTGWCKHIQHVVRERLDMGCYEPMRYMVPVVPTEGIFCPVHLSEVPTPNANGIVVEVSMIMTIVGTDDDKRHVIGYLPLDTMSVSDLRMLCLDWLAGWLDNTKYFAEPVCANKDHDPAKAAGSSAFATRLYPAMYGLCLPCMTALSESSATPSQDAPKF